MKECTEVFFFQKKIALFRFGKKYINEDDLDPKDT